MLHAIGERVADETDVISGPYLEFRGRSSLVGVPEGAVKKAKGDEAGDKDGQYSQYLTTTAVQALTA
jgi:hypothetical protein